MVPGSASAAYQCKALFLKQQKTLQRFSSGRPQNNDVKTSPIESSDFIPGSPAGNLFQLIQRGWLLPQYSTPLARHNLIIEKGGLCGPTCAINLLSAVYYSPRTAHILANYGHQILSSYVKQYSAVTGLDARKDTTMDHLTNVFSGPFLSTFSKYFPGFQIKNVSLLRYDVFYGPDLISLNDRTVALATAFTQKPNSGISSTGHAFIILKLDPMTNTLFISDPNIPNQPMKVPFTVDSDGYIKTYLPQTFHDQPVFIDATTLFRFDN